MNQRVSTDASKPEAIAMEWNTFKKSLKSVNKQWGHLSAELNGLPDLLLIIIFSPLVAWVLWMGSYWTTKSCVESVSVDMGKDIIYISWSLEVGTGSSVSLPIAGAQ